MEKYRVRGPDAEFLKSTCYSRHIKAEIDKVTYVIWCNDEGKVLDDGTLFRLSDNDYRLCAQHHQLDWLGIFSLGFDVSIEKETDQIAALAVQGPASYAVLSRAGFEGLDKLKPFHFLRQQIFDIDLMISRTVTGDLGYEIWISPEHQSICGI